MTADLRRQIAELDLPLPLEPLLYGVLRASNPDRRHRQAVQAWEVLVQVAATATWSACRALGLSSDAFARYCAGLRRPSFGHWTGLLREGLRLLDGRTEAEAAALATLAEGLKLRISDVESAAALRDAFGRLPKPLKVSGRDLLALVGSMPAYRNRTEGHPDERPQSGELAVNAALLMEALLALCRVAPPLGDLKLATVTQIEERGGDEVHAELMVMHGGGATRELVPIGPGARDRIQPARAYLRGSSPGVWLPLWPLAAATREADEWRVGWLKNEVRGPTFHYAPFTAEGFRTTLEPEEYARLLGVRPDEDESALPEELLALEPYRGLLAYDEAHAPFFFGREAECERAIEALDRDGALVVCGASGSGKSSLVRAGVLPRLRARAEARQLPLTVLDLVPGPTPVDALRAALRGVPMSGAGEVVDWQERVDRLLGPSDAADAGLHVLLSALTAMGREVVVVVDQLEEAVTVCDEPDQRARFFDEVATAARRAAESGARLVLTVRADLIAGLLEHEGMRTLFDDCLLTLGSLGEAELSEVIRGPLRGRSVELESGLPERITNDLGAEPGSLALLSVVLTTLWQERGRYGNALTRAGYDEAGGVQGALARRADQAWTAIPKRLHHDAERVLVRLARIEADGRVVRDRASRSELREVSSLSEGDLDAIIDPLLANRLLVASRLDDTVTLEVAHEALLRSWPRLVDLLVAEREAIVLRQEVTAAARAWEAAGRASELWTDATTRLARAEELVEAGRLSLSVRESGFLRASRGLVARRRMLRRMATVAIVVLAILAAVMWYRADAARQRTEAALSDATAARVRAETAEQQAEASRGRSESLVAFVLTDFFDTLQDLGQVELLEGVLDGVGDYYDALPEPSPDDPPRTLDGRAEFLVALSDVQLSAGRLTEAVDALEAAVRLRRWSLEQRPDDVEATIALARTLRDLGGTLGRAERDDERLPVMREVESLYAALDDRGNSTPESLRLLAEVRLRVAALEQGRWYTVSEEDEPVLREAVALCERALHAVGQPGDNGGREQRFDVMAQLLDHLADLQDGYLYEQRVNELTSLIRMAMADDPGNEVWERRLADTLRGAAAMYGVTLDPPFTEAARRMSDEAIRLAEMTIARRPRSSRWREDLAGMYVNRSGIEYDAGNGEEACAFLRHAVNERRALSEQDPSNRTRRTVLGSTATMAGYRCLPFLPDYAVEVTTESVAVFRVLYEADPTDTMVASWYPLVQADLANAYLQIGDVDGAENAVRTGLEAIGALREREPDNEGMLEAEQRVRARLAEVLIARGEGEQAVTMLEELAAELAEHGSGVAGSGAPWNACNVQHFLGQARLATGDEASAREAFAEMFGSLASAIAADASWVANPADWIRQLLAPLTWMTDELADDPGSGLLREDVGTVARWLAELPETAVPQSEREATFDALREAQATFAP